MRDKVPVTRFCDLPGYRARSYVRMMELDFPGAQADAETAVELAPRDSSRVRSQQGLTLAISGRLPEAIAATNRALELDPVSDEAWNNLGYYLMANGDFVEARRALTRALAITPEGDDPAPIPRTSDSCSFQAALKVCG